MGARAVAVAGSGASFVAAAVAGVLGNQLSKDALWAWIAFGLTLLIGAGVTALVTHRSLAGNQSPEPEPRTVEGPVTGRGDITLKGEYVAGHDLTVNHPGRRGKKR
ncbi:hypothetical protein ACWEVP_43790 [Amycolatopsis sp. NPDC003865]